jgi:organic radical activating enzyme
VTYAVKEIFSTLQGEGAMAGTPSCFVRFVGCNLWNGHDEARERAAADGPRCPLWCDTDFRPPGDRMEASAIARAVAESGMLHVVFTGGEPLLQLDEELLRAVRREAPGVTLAVETNGTKPAPHGLDWVSVSPKLPVARLTQRAGDELRVVFPAYDPGDYESIAASFEHRFVSPQALTGSVGVSVLSADATRRAIAYCLEHPRWRLSTQQHKILGLP